MKKFWLTTLLATFLATWSLTAAAADIEGPRVVVSIKPLHSLVAGVMEGVGEPQLLIKGGGSPHGYVLRPSEARMLDKAQMVVWVGPALESFLVKPLAILGGQARQLELAEVLTPQLLPLRKGGAWERHDHGDKAHAGHHDHDLMDLDPHFWLDPRLAKRVVVKTAAALAAIDPAHRQRYQENADRLQERLDALNVELAAELAPVRNVPYVVFHDAYQYFEAAYGLNAVGSLTLDPERMPGAKRIEEIRQKILSLKARCLFSEPQFTSRLVGTVTEGTGAGTGVLDPLGSQLPQGPDCYFLLMQAMADNLVAGLNR